MLPKDTCLSFYRAQPEPQQSWRTNDVEMESRAEACLRARDNARSKAAWCGMFADLVVEETRDPLRTIERVQARVREHATGGTRSSVPKWCTECIAERLGAWEKAREEWWAMLDKWLPRAL